MKWFTTAFVSLAFSFSLSSAHKEDVSLYDEIEVQEPKIQVVNELPYSEPTIVDPQPSTKLDIVSLNLFPTEYEKDVIARLEEGIYRAKLHPESGEPYWFECGEKYTKEAAKNRAHEWAYHIVRAVHYASDNPYVNLDPYMLNVWKVAGTINNESGFDECTMGLFVRKYGIKAKIIEPKKLTVSYTREEVLKVANDPRTQWAFKDTGLDLGPLQVLDKYIDISIEDMLTIENGLYAQVEHMKQRGVQHDTDMPWLTWPNFRISENGWYDEKISKRAKKLGAYDWEI